MKKLTTRDLRAHKKLHSKRSLSMLTCYDFQTASLLNETDLDTILVGDSLGNVILGYETTIEVTLNDMITFGSAVKRGAPNKFTIIDMPFGTYSTLTDAVKNATELFQKTKAEALKIEGAFDSHLEIIKTLTQNGIPVVGHIGLTPQSVHEQGGYYTHGKNDESVSKLLEQAKRIQDAGACMLVLECVKEELSETITNELSIATIGIGSGTNTDGQVLVINDLLKMGPNMPPKFCKPITDLYSVKKDLINKYLDELK